MEVRRLAWAGLEVRAGGQVAVIDFVEDFRTAARPRTPSWPSAPGPAAGTVDVGLLTHLHDDHADVAALQQALRPEGHLLRPERAHGSGAETALVQGPESALEASDLAGGG